MASPLQHFSGKVAHHYPIVNAPRDGLAPRLLYNSACFTTDSKHALYDMIYSKSAPHLGPRTLGEFVQKSSTAIFGGGQDLHQKLGSWKGTPKKMFENSAITL